MSAYERSGESRGADSRQQWHPPERGDNQEDRADRPLSPLPLGLSALKSDRALMQSVVEDRIELHVGPLWSLIWIVSYVCTFDAQIDLAPTGLPYAKENLVFHLRTALIDQSNSEEIRACGLDAFSFCKLSNDSGQMLG